MDNWTERIKNSSALAELNTALSAVKASKNNEPSAAQLDALDRLEYVIRLILHRIENADPRLISKHLLDTIGSHAGNLRSHIDAWKQRSNEEYLTVHAQNMIDNILQLLPQIPYVEINYADEMLKSLRNSVSGHRLAVDRATKQLESEVSLAKQSFTQEIETSEDLVSQLKKQVAAAEEKLNTVEASNSKLTVQLQEAFIKSQNIRGEQFDALISEKQQTLNDAIAELETATKSDTEKLMKAIRSDEAAANEAKTRIEELLGITGEEALIGSYSKAANQDAFEANFWRWVTVGSIVAAIGVAVWASIPLLTNSTVVNPDWFKLVAKLLLVVSLSALATYAGKQSSEHRKAQRDSNHMAAQLAAVKPYLNDMSDTDKRDELLKSIANKLFGRAAEHRLTTKNMKSAKLDNPELLQQAIAVIKNITSKE